MATRKLHDSPIKIILAYIIFRLKHYWAAVILIVFLAYGMVILIKGIAAGVYLTDEASKLYLLNRLISWWLNLEFIPVTTDPYTLSFFASAEQDFWFFLIIGLAVSIPTIRSPKTDGIRAKVGHFFPSLSESSPYMEEVILMMNKASCITTEFTRQMVILEREGDFIRLVVNTKFKLKNLHHNHSLDHNIGNFSIKPDASVRGKYPIWGELIRFTDVAGNSISAPNKMAGDEFHVQNYNIKLDPNEEREYNCNYTMWVDLKEPIIIGFIRFTERFTIEILNQTSFTTEITIDREKNESTLRLKDTALSSTESLSITEDDAITYLSCDDKIKINVNIKS